MDTVATAGLAASITISVSILFKLSIRYYSYKTEGIYIITLLTARGSDICKMGYLVSENEHTLPTNARPFPYCSLFVPGKCYAYTDTDTPYVSLLYTEVSVVWIAAGMQLFSQLRPPLFLLPKLWAKHKKIQILL